MIGKLASLKVTGSSHGSSDYQKQVVEHVLQKPFTTLEAYYDFWARMEDASKNDATFFFCVLAQKMLSADKRAATGADVALGVSGASVLGTMLQLVLYYPVQAEDKEMKALSKKLRQSSGRSTIDSLTVEALFEMVGKGTKRDTLVSFVERASSVDPPSTAGSPDRDPSAFAYGLLFGYLQQCVRQREQVPQILKTLLGILRLGHPLLTPTRALALLHMLTHVIVEFPRWTEEELAETRQAVAPLLLWARPVGGDAQACLALIDAEIRLRAASAWLVLQRDVGWLGVADDVACSHLGLGALADATTVHFALDEQADWGRAFRQLFLEAQPAAPPTEGVRAAIASMLFALFHNASPPLNIKPAKLAALPDAVVVQLAAQAMRLVQAAADGRGMVAEGLQAMAAVVAQASEVDGRASAVASDLQRTRLPELEYSILDGNAVPAAQVRALREAAELAGQRGYLYNPYVGALHAQLTAAAAAAADGLPPPTMRLCVAGGDDTLQRVAQAYVVLRCAHPELCAAVRLLCYLVPIGRSNRLASYIAMRDGWYLRHVYAAHSGGHPTVPHLIVPAWEKTKPERSSSPGGSPEPPPRPPQAPLREALDDYYRGARAVLPLKLFEARCYLAPPRAAEEKPFVTIAFCGSVEVQLAAAAGEGQALAVEYSLGDPWGVECARDAANRRPPAARTDRAHRPSLNPHPHARFGRYASPMSIGARFSSLSFSTFGLEPLHSPASGRLQMRCAHTTPNSKGTPSGPLRHVMRAKISCGAAALGDVKSPATPRAKAAAAERFSILVDGEWYGPFAHVELAPCVRPGSSEALTLPLATFIPVDLLPD